MLSNVDIHEALTSGGLVISPLGPNAIQPASVDLRLDSELMTDSARTYKKKTFETFKLAPLEFILGSTLETVEIPANLTAKVEGKSSWARRGLVVHLTAGFIDPGFKGNITLEIVNLSPYVIELTPHIYICQLSFYELKTPSSLPYGTEGLGSKYQNQSGPTGAR